MGPWRSVNFVLFRNNLAYWMAAVSNSSVLTINDPSLQYIQPYLDISDLRSHSFLRGWRLMTASSETIKVTYELTCWRDERQSHVTCQQLSASAACPVTCATVHVPSYLATEVLVLILNWHWSIRTGMYAFSILSSNDAAPRTLTTQV